MYCATIITLEPCALNAEFQHTDLIKFHYIVDTTDLRLKEGFGGGERRPKDRVTSRISLLYIWFYKIGQL